MDLNETSDGRSQIRHTIECVPIEHPPFQLRKPALHGVQPGGAGRYEVQLEAGISALPAYLCS